MRRVGVAPETRKFTPHVTLARLRRVRPRAVADYLASRGALAVEAFTAARFVLYSAREGSGGGPYVVEAAYPLELEMNSCVREILCLDWAEHYG